MKRSTVVKLVIAISVALATVAIIDLRRKTPAEPALPAPPPEQTAPQEPPRKETPKPIDDFAPFETLFKKDYWPFLTKKIVQLPMTYTRDNLGEEAEHGGMEMDIRDDHMQRQWTVEYKCHLFISTGPLEVLETLTIKTEGKTLSILRVGDMNSADLITVNTQQLELMQDQNKPPTIKRNGGTVFTAEEASKRLTQCRELLERVATSTK